MEATAYTAAYVINDSDEEILMSIDDYIDKFA